MAEKQKGGNFLLVFLIILGILIILAAVWGYIGGQTAKDSGITCDWGIKDFCWKWHKNVAGQVGEFLGDLLNGN